MDTATILNALAQETRAQILLVLTEGPHSLSELARSIGKGVPCIWDHVNRLEQASLVVTTRKGRRRIVKSRYHKIDVKFA